ncbi:transcriptional repressor [Stutzerimonas stutzeri]|nr:transcriptional repressor [Stutzerimonas stutzeri]MCQ4261551.1 transcriptional repressor [Stutzerimonas stutzeri]
MVGERQTEQVALDDAADDRLAQNVALTPIRRQVLMLLQRHPEGIKAYHLLAIIRTLKPNAAPPTVYRALNYLVAHGLAHKISCMNMFIACDRSQHPQNDVGVFLVCPHCHSVKELHDDAASHALNEALALAGYRLDRSVMEIGAVCPGCTQANAPT